MTKTKGFTNSSKKDILIKIVALFLGSFFLSTMSYAQIFTGKLLLIGNNYSTKLEENKNQDLDVFSIQNSNEDLRLTDEIFKNLTELSLKKANYIISISSMKTLVLKSDLGDNEQKEDLELPPVNRLFKFVPILVVFTI